MLSSLYLSPTIYQTALHGDREKPEQGDVVLCHNWLCDLGLSYPPWVSVSPLAKYNRRFLYPFRFQHCRP